MCVCARVAAEDALLKAAFDGDLARVKGNHHPAILSPLHRFDRLIQWELWSLFSSPCVLLCGIKLLDPVQFGIGLFRLAPWCYAMLCLICVHAAYKLFFWTEFAYKLDYITSLELIFNDDACNWAIKSISLCLVFGNYLLKRGYDTCLLCSDHELASGFVMLVYMANYSVT